MSEISALRLKQAGLERENVELKDRFGVRRSTGDLLTYIDTDGYNSGGNNNSTRKFWDSKPPLGTTYRSESPHQNSVIDSATGNLRTANNGNALDHGMNSGPPQAPRRVKVNYTVT